MLLWESIKQINRRLWSKIWKNRTKLRNKFVSDLQTWNKLQERQRFLIVKQKILRNRLSPEKKSSNKSKTSEIFCEKNFFWKFSETSRHFWDNRIFSENFKNKIRVIYRQNKISDQKSNDDEKKNLKISKIFQKNQTKKNEILNFFNHRSSDPAENCNINTPKIFYILVKRSKSWRVKSFQRGAYKRKNCEKNQRKCKLNKNEKISWKKKNFSKNFLLYMGHSISS